MHFRFMSRSSICEQILPYLTLHHMGESVQDYSWFQDFEADFP